MARPKKVERFKLAAHTNHSGSKSWKVSGTTPTGERIRKFFANKSEAIRERNDLEMDAAGTSEVRRALRTSFTAEELSDAEAAAEQAGSKKLSDIVSHYLSLEQRSQQKGVSLDQAITFVESRYRPETQEITIFNAKQEFLESRIDVSEATLQNYTTNLAHLVKSDPNKSVHAFTLTDIEQVLARYSNLNTRKTLRRNFSVFFNWAVRHHYCLENPCDRLDRLPKDVSKIVVLSLDEVKRLLQAAIHYRDGISAATVAIAIFAGLRPSELAELKPKDIRRGMIIVRDGGKKRREGQRRVPVPEVLQTWLNEFPFSGLPKGWDYKRKRLKEVTNANQWVSDIFRHTSITYQAERDKNEGVTAINNGTSNGMLDRHYLSFIEDEETISEFWNLTPDVIRKTPMKIKLPSTQQVDWPTKSKLKKLVWEKPLVHAATDIGVSNVALKKHCEKLSIELPPRGYWLKEPANRSTS